MCNYVKLYRIEPNVICLQCGNKGAVQFHGNYYPTGIGDKLDTYKTDIVQSIMEKYRDKPYMDYAVGFGGTIPYKCLNCGNEGLIDTNGLEGYKMAFRNIGK